MSDKTNSPFENSLFYLALKSVIEEIQSPENTYYAGEHFHNDPREHCGERLLHYIESGRMSEVLKEFRDSHPELVCHLPSKPGLKIVKDIAA